MRTVKRILLGFVICFMPSFKVTPLFRLVHVSTVDVYGFHESPCNELSDASGGEFGYGRSKLIGEDLVRQWGKEHSMPFTIVRPCNVIGPGSQFIQRIGQSLNRV
ncbi:NAD-dependent epimerase/dehydratase family protein [Candidatus Aalborgicola defluviihabitans]|uniref:NAD-dependent epimerase/dehydratase family protein n=1 Tax=Candidatus Aalborgicola defluviihabitans TaxID=3386187 RepID=UPI0039B91750